MTPPLFSPYRLDELELANRLVMAPMTRGCWPSCWRSPGSGSSLRSVPSRSRSLSRRAASSGWRWVLPPGSPKRHLSDRVTTGGCPSFLPAS